jgi:hypothetical protein
MEREARTLVFVLYATILPTAFDFGLWGAVKVVLMILGASVTLIAVWSLFEGPYSLKIFRRHKDHG